MHQIEFFLYYIVPFQFTVIGWSNCNEEYEWEKAYSGYLMAISSSNGLNSPSDPICVDQTPAFSDGYGTEPNAPQLTFVKSGNGLWLKDKFIPCTVCVKK